ncbi:ABC transporter substrate-binding protein [Ammoniphilus sp. 3BR4]|uniref:ABC transporter substrate-binding protein n=1 Tax=Ammoniphilus sp. 3BR4 TaxID=3158265 RepID=UPI00346710E1
MKSILSGIIISTLLASTLTACGSQDTGSATTTSGNTESSDVIRIAHIGPFSGNGVSYGTWDSLGIEMAVAEVNEKGGIQGKKIEIVKIDDQGNPTVSVNAAHKVINEGVTAVFATPLSTTTLATLEAFNQAKIPQLSAGQGIEITTKGSQYIFRYNASSSTFTKTSADYLVNKRGFKKIAIITNSGAFGRGEHDTFTAELKAMNVTPVADEVVTPDAKDFSAQLSNIKNANPDAVYIGTEDIQGGLITKQARALGITAQIVGGASFATDVYVNTAGKENAEGTIFTTTYIDDDSEEVKAFKEAYKKKYGKEAEAPSFIAKGYDGAKILIEALNKAYPNLDGEHIRSALLDLNYDALIGNFDFNETGEGLENAQLGIIKDGQFKSLE